MRAMKRSFAFLALIFVVKTVQAADSCYTYPELHFKITSKNGLILQKNYPSLSHEYEGAMVYDYVEFAGGDACITEIKVTDCSSYLEAQHENENEFWKKYELANFAAHYPLPDTTYYFRIINARTRKICF